MAEEFYHSEAVLHPIPPERHHWAFQEILRSDQYLGGYIFLDSGKPAGFPAYQGRGYGTQAIEALSEDLKGKAAAIRLEVTQENPRARALYERMGFQPVNYLQMQKTL